ncbi:MAG: hypothetical protein RMJ84_11215 [Sandaracinaceae bacterium]|nr:hypothetical protein [Sandaracinaceae bacterium]
MLPSPCFFCFSPPPPRRHLLLAPLIGFAPFQVGLFWKLLTGETLPNGALAKLLLVDPVLSEGEIREWVERNLRHVVEVWLGDGASHRFPHLLVPVSALLGIFTLRKQPRAGVPLAFGLVALLLSLVMSIYAPVETHFDRYLMPYLLPLLVWSAWGAFQFGYRLFNLTLPLSLGRPLTFCLCFTWLGWLGSTYEGLHTIAKRCVRDIRVCHGTMNAFLMEFLKEMGPEERIGITDAGAHAFVARAKIVDFIGLTTQGMALDYRAGPGSQLEAYERLPPHVRPRFALSFFSMGWWQPAEPLMAERVFTVWLNDSPQIVPAPLYELIRLRTELLEGQDQPFEAGALIDRLDISDLQSERTHEMPPLRGRWAMFQNRIVIGKKPDGRELIEGCRELSSPITFRMRTAKHALLVFRGSAPEGAEFEVQINESTHHVQLPPSPPFTEFKIPAPEHPTHLPISLRPIRGNYMVCHIFVVLPPSR